MTLEGKGYDDEFSELELKASDDPQAILIKCENDLALLRVQLNNCAHVERAQGLEAKIIDLKRIIVRLNSENGRLKQAVSSLHNGIMTVLESTKEFEDLL